MDVHRYKRTNSRVWVNALPRPDNQYKRHVRACRLCFQRQPVRLQAAQFDSTSGTQQRVLLFSNVEFNPDVWPEPDLSGYTQEKRSNETTSQK